MARILIIDDESDFLELLYTLLAREGHEVESAPNLLDEKIQPGWSEKHCIDRRK